MRIVAFWPGQCWLTGVLIAAGLLSASAHGVQPYTACPQPDLHQSRASLDERIALLDRQISQVTETVEEWSARAKRWRLGGRIFGITRDFLITQGASAYIWGLRTALTGASMIGRSAIGTVGVLGGEAARNLSSAGLSSLITRDDRSRTTESLDAMEDQLQEKDYRGLRTELYRTLDDFHEAHVRIFEDSTERMRREMRLSFGRVARTVWNPAAHNNWALKAKHEAPRLADHLELLLTERDVVTRLARRVTRACTRAVETARNLASPTAGARTSNRTSKENGYWQRESGLVPLILRQGPGADASAGH